MEPGGLLQARPECTVALEEGGAIVTKTFCGADPHLQARLAHAEFERLRVFHSVLGDVQGVSCPEPLEIVAGAAPQLRMTRAPGVSLIAVLRRRRLDPMLLRRLGAKATLALTLYVDALAEPYHDFHFDNMLYDEHSEMLTLVDFGYPLGQESPATASSPLVISLGNLIGSTVFQSAKPNEFTRLRQHSQAIELCADVVTAVIESRDVAPDELARAARAAYNRAAHDGPWFRRLWYLSAAPLVARRLVVGHATFTAWPRRMKT